MTTLGHSPPRSKKESFAASSFSTAGSIVAGLDDESRQLNADQGPARTVDDVDEPPRPDDVGERERVEPVHPDTVDEAEGSEPTEPRPDSRAAKAGARAAARREREKARNASRQARVDAKQAARAQREAVTQTKRDAKAEQRLKRLYAEQHGRKRREEEAREHDADPVEATAPVASDAVSEGTPEQESEPRPELQPEPPPKQSIAKADPGEAKEAARQERRDARAAARSVKAKDKRDRIVEPPREPKVSLLERRRQKAAAKAAAKADPSNDSTSPDPPERGRHAIAVAAVMIGVIGLVCSLILAFGAFLVALGTGETNGTYDLVSGICDVLVGPLRGAFTFSGANAEMKEAVVAWGLGSMGYVLVGLFAQSYLRSRLDR